MRVFIDGWFNKYRKVRVKSAFIDPKLVQSCMINQGIESKASSTFMDTCRELKLNKIFKNRFKYMGKLTNFTITVKLWMYNKVCVLRNHVNLGCDKLTDVIKQVRGVKWEWNSILPLPINNVSKIVGVYPRKYKRNYIKKKVFTTNYYRLWIINDIVPSFRKFYDSFHWFVMDGSWENNQQNLINMATDHDRKYSVSELLGGIKSRIGKDLFLPLIPNFDPNLLLDISVNGKAYPGIRTSEEFGSKRKFSTPFTKCIADNYLRHILNSEQQVLDCSLYYVGGREKRIKVVLGEEKQVYTRITLGQEDVPTLIGQTLAKSINEPLQIFNKGFNWGGRINGRLNFQKFIDILSVKSDVDVKHGMVTTSIDFSGHDNGVSENQIVVSFALLRLCFPESKKIDRLFYYVMSSMIFKRIVLPNSNIIYEITKGLATGHAMTSIVTTCCAYLTLATALNKVLPTKELELSRLQGAGDDWNIKVPESKLQKLTNEINSNSGSKCTDLTENAGQLTDDGFENKPTFLKKTYAFGLIGWNCYELFINFIFPTSTKYMSLSTKLYDLIAMCVSGPFNFRINAIVQRIMVYEIYDYYIRRKCHRDIMSGARVYMRWMGKLLDTMKVIVMGYNIQTKLLPELYYYMPNIGLSILMGSTVNVKNLCNQWLRKMDKRITNSMKWMLANRLYIAFEKVHRLKVFDLNKTYYAPRKYICGEYLLL